VTADNDTPPEWVSRSERVHWIIWIARHHDRRELDEAGAEDLIPYVVEALRHDPDDTIDRRPFARRTQDGLFDEIAFLDDYDVDWRIWELRRRKRLEEDPPDWRGRTFMMAVAWYKFVQAVRRAVEQTRSAAATPTEQASSRQKTGLTTPPKFFVPTGLLTLTQAIDRLINTQAPDLRAEILRKGLELHALPPPVSRAPPPIRPLGQRTAWRGPRERSAPPDAEAVAKMVARNQLRAQLEEDLWKDRAAWAMEREQAIVRLGQAFCDAAVQTWLLMETTGERTPIPAERWSTREAVAAFQSGSYVLITPVSILKGTVVVLAADLDGWLASKGASPASPQIPPIPKKRGPKAFKRDPTVDRMVKDYAGRAPTLDDEREKTLAATYGVSRTTAREAKRIALSKLRQIPT
jgi:hypothetical protein